MKSINLSVGKIKKYPLKGDIATEMCQCSQIDQKKVFVPCH